MNTNFINLLLYYTNRSKIVHTKWGVRIIFATRLSRFRFSFVHRFRNEFRINKIIANVCSQTPASLYRILCYIYITVIVYIAH